MTCPSCENTLQAIEVTSDHNGIFSVDHCGHCGGTWFDPYEINRIPYYEVVRLAHQSVWQNTKPPQNDDENNDEIMRCPNDQSFLEILQGDPTPAGVRFFRCSICKGIWATQKALLEFKKEQEKNNPDSLKDKKSLYSSVSVYFAPAALLILLFFSTFVMIIHLSTLRDIRTYAASQVEDVAVTPAVPDGLLLTFKTQNPVRTQITYGEGLLTRKTKWISVSPTTTHFLVLSELTAGTLQTYTLTLEDETGATYTTPEKKFASGE